MVRIALDPTPYNDRVPLLEFSALVARLGCSWRWLTPNPALGRHLRSPKLDDAMVPGLKKRAADAGVER